MKKLFILLAAALLAAPVFAQKTTVTRVNREKTYKTSTRDIAIWYQGELNVGYGTGGNLKFDGTKIGDAEFGRPFIETIHGARITKYAFVGLGLGVQYSTEWKELMMPIFVDLKGYYPVSETLAPYVQIDLGYGVGLGDLDGGFHCGYGVGLNYKRLNFGFGGQHQMLFDKIAVNSFVVKVGLKF